MSKAYDGKRQLDRTSEYDQKDMGADDGQRGGIGSSWKKEEMEGVQDRCQKTKSPKEQGEKLGQDGKMETNEGRFSTG